MVWAHSNTMAGGMTSPLRFQEVLAAAFHFDTTETIDEVNARHEREDEEAEERAAEKAKRRSGRRRGRVAPSAPSIVKPVPKASYAELSALLGAADQARSQSKDLLDE